MMLIFALKFAGKRTIEDDDLDAKAISELTKFTESHIVTIHSEWMSMIGTSRCWNSNV